MITQTKKSRPRAGLALVALAGLSVVLAQAQTAVPSTYRLPVTAADASKPGFVFRIHSVGRSLPTTLARTESQLAGNEGANIADPNVTGPALAPAAAPNPASAPITFEVPTVINMEQAGGSSGNVTPDDQMPGIPATNGSTDGIAAEVLTWLELPAGETLMGVNSDDGFRVTIGGASPEDKFNSINVGQFDAGRGAADTTFRITVAEAGLYAARLIWNEGGGGASVEWFTQAADGTKTLIGDPAGLKAYRAVTTPPARAFVRTALPSPGFALAAPNQRITVELVDGATAVPTSSVKLFLDNTDLNVTPTKAGNVTTVNFTPTTLFASGSSHNISFVYTDAGTSVTQNWSFAVQPYASIPPSLKVTPDTTKPGFIWNIFANTANQVNSNERTELALGGLLYDTPANGGARLLNVADPAAQGIAAAPSSAPNPDYAPIRFEIPTIINMSQNGTDNAGNWTVDSVMPGLPGTDGAINGVAAELLTLIELPAGLVTMGVNSDDGFLTTIGWDATSRQKAGEFNGGRGAADTIFNVFVQEAGVYPFRTSWEEGGGGANIEWFSVNAAGTKIPINGTNGFKAYRAVSGAAQPYVSFINPDRTPRQLNTQPRQVDILIADGASPVDLNSIALKIDGNAVTTTKTREGTSVRVVYAPTTLQVPTDIHSAELTFRTTGSTADITRQWQFRNLKNLVLPTPKATENFDSYPEDGVPPGWVAFNFSSDCAEGDVRDPADQTSDSYKDWNLVSVANMTSLDGGSINVAPGQFFNGQPVDAIASGNVLYAESDGRCNSDAGALNFGQAQFVISKPFDLSQVTNVVLTFSSLYTQNQDSMGGVEYSVDGGTNWLPVVYFIDSVDAGGDIKYRADGSVDALATLNSLNGDTANWIQNGVAKGDNYGAGVAAPITQALADYITPRLNDDQTEGHRIEVFRLPAASRKSDVRLRLAQLGTDSWWFAVDNIAFYEDPNAPTGGGGGDEIRITGATVTGGNITIVWTGGGTLESTTSLSSPVTWTTTGDSDGSHTAAATGTRFFRVRR
jgi:hypothetical protein